MMPSPSLLPVLFRELFGKRCLPRELEPNLIMDSSEQIKAFEEAGRSDGTMKASYLLHAARISMVLNGAKRVVDLGCGPASQLALIAELNPDISFLGIDYSEKILESARNYVKEKNLLNVEFQKGDITDLSSISDSSFDGVITTMTLHHVPSIPDLKKCFSEAKRILKPNGKLYMVDFGRLKYLKSISYFVDMNKDHQPFLFSQDYELSLKAAFSLSDYKILKKEFFYEYELLSTFLVPFIIIIKSKDAKLKPQILKSIKDERQNLSPKYRKTLDDLRFFMRLGGLKNDPF